MGAQLDPKRISRAGGWPGVARCFADRLEAYGDRPALILPDGSSMSYSALAAAADRAPLPAERTLLALPASTTAEFVVLYVAALRRRHPVILIDEAASALGKQVIATYAPWMPGGTVTKDNAATALHADLAVLLATSGSTGSPKLVRLSLRNVDSNARAIAQYLGLDRDDRAITSLPFHYSYGLSVLNSHLSVGASIVLTDLSVSDPRFWTLLRTTGATHLAGVPYSYELFERMGMRAMDLPSLRVLTQAGGRLPAERVSAYADWAAERGIRFFVMYGQTEATARMAYLPPSQARENPDCVGIAIPGGRFELRQVPEAVDGVGELVYRGPNVMMGYAQMPADLALGHELTELATGDLAVRTEAGLYRVVGRRSRFSKLFGLRISHDMVESWLAREIGRAVVTGDDQQLIVLSEDVEPDGAATALAAHLGLPVTCIQWLVGPIPRLSSGKPDLRAIHERIVVMRSESADRKLAPGSVTEIFAHCFPGVAVNPSDSFTSLGGDSLTYVNFSIALEECLGSAPDGWERLTLRELEQLAERVPSRSATVRRIDSDVIVRAVATCSIVGLHAGAFGGQGLSINMGGGAIMLMTLFGYNMARFQQDALLSPDRLQPLLSFAKRIILPYYGLLLLYLLYKKQFDPAALLLVSSFQGRFGNVLEPFWFLESSLLALGCLVLLLAVPPVQRLARERPSIFAASLVAGALVLKGAGSLLLDQQFLQQRTLDAVFIYVAIGWAAWVVKSWAGRLAVLAAALATVAASYGPTDQHMMWILAGLGLVLFVPRLPLPRPLAALIVTIAMASFQIYLCHNFVIWIMRNVAGVGDPAVTMATALVAGVALAWLLRQRVDALLAYRRSAPATLTG